MGLEYDDQPPPPSKKPKQLLDAQPAQPEQQDFDMDDGSSVDDDDDEETGNVLLEGAEEEPKAEVVAARVMKRPAAKANWTCTDVPTATAVTADVLDAADDGTVEATSVAVPCSKSQQHPQRKHRKHQNLKLCSRRNAEGRKHRSEYCPQGGAQAGPGQETHCHADLHWVDECSSC